MIFGQRADHYDTYRPSYPAGVIDIVVERDPANAVDAGCGTGKAASLVAKRGVAVLGVEPDALMAEVARGHGIEVTVTKIEDWSAAPCDVMYSAQAWHWVDPQRGAEVAAASIRSGGQWVGFWNYETDSDFTECREAVYARLAPELSGITVSTVDGALRVPISSALAATEAFDEMEVREVSWNDQLSVEAAVQRLASHSKHQLLEADRSAEFDRALTNELGAAADQITLPYTTRIFSASRR